VNRREFVARAAASLPIALPGFLSAEQLPVPRTYTYKKAGGCVLKADVYGASFTVKKPVIFWIHGGALIFGTRRYIEAPRLGELFLSNGYALVSIDYRLAPETKLPAIIKDVQDAYRWVHELGPRLFNIDPGRLAVAGGSAGGYLALMAGFCVRPRPRALLSLSGYGDIDGPWYSQPSPHYLRHALVSKEEAFDSVVNGCVCETPEPNPRFRFYVYCRQQGLWPEEVTGRNPHTEPRWFDRYCPVRNVSAEYPPSVLIHGTADTDVPHQESVDMDAKLSEFGVEHRFLSVPGGGHELDNGVAPDVKEKIFEQGLAFIKAHTG